MCKCLVPMLLLILIALLAPIMVAYSGTSKDDYSRDVRQTIQARMKLLEEPELAGLNIGVLVQNRVAILWGPVPSAEVAFRAEFCLRGIIDLVEIRNELFVREDREPVKTPVKQEPRPTPSEPLPPPLPKQQRPILGAPGALTGQEGSAKKPRSIEVKAPLPSLGLPQAEKHEAKASEPEQLSEAERKVAIAVRTLLNGNVKYRDVQFAVKEGRVYLRVANGENDALHEAAREISRLPNVAGVVLLDKQASRIP